MLKRKIITKGEVFLDNSGEKFYFFDTVAFINGDGQIAASFVFVSAKDEHTLSFEYYDVDTYMTYETQRINTREPS